VAGPLSQRGQGTRRGRSSDDVGLRVERLRMSLWHSDYRAELADL
jgi:hypothetical protein